MIRFARLWLAVRAFDLGCYRTMARLLPPADRDKVRRFTIDMVTEDRR